MSAGKSTAQACHAARLSLLKFLQKYPERASEFINLNSVGTIVILDAPNLLALQKMAAKAALLGLPWSLFVDSGHVHPPSFDGSPIPTALAIGPALQEQIRPITHNLRCLKDTPKEIVQ
jgi:PTH2 family peptidyl-tRNA hydrolase